MYTNIAQKELKAQDTSRKKYTVFSHYKYMYRELWRYDRKSFLMIFTQVVTNVVKPLVAAWLPAFMVGILEDGCTAKELITACLLVYTGVVLLYGGNVVLNSQNSLYYQFLRLRHLVLNMLKTSIEMDCAKYEQEKTQNEMQKCKNALEGGTSPDAFYSNSVALLTGVIGLIVYSVLIARLHLLIVLLLLGMSVIQYLIFQLAKKNEEKHRDGQTVHNRYQEYLFSQSTDLKSGKDVRLYQLQKWLIPLYEMHNREHLRQFAKNQSMYFMSDFVGLLLTFVRDAVSYGFLIYMLIQGMDISEFILYLGVIGGYGNWFGQISDRISKISRTLIGVNDYRTYIDEEFDYRRGDKELKLQDTESIDIVFENVSFQYPGSERLVLNDISFHIRSTEKIALVGINGAGKTTLVKLLCGFYRPTKGRIMINGIDIMELNCEQYRELISVLFQESVLLPYTIAQNVTGQVDEEIDRERLWAVLRQCGLADKIETLPRKENSFIGKDFEEDGIQLSGGQIQKLFLARALYKRSCMLILDEPTAALDAMAESEMYEQYSTLVEGKTSVYISHRLSSTRFCDRILFLENGQIAESGSHQELMEQDGRYAEMFRVQSQYYTEEDNK